MNAWRWALIAWIGVIFFSSTSLAGEWSEQVFSYLCTLLLSQLKRDSSSYGLIHLLADKSLHLVLFCILAILFWKALPNVRRKIALILLFGAIVGSCSEFLQRFFPGRDPAIRDVLINIGGTAIGLVIISVHSTLHARASPAMDARSAQT